MAHKSILRGILPPVFTLAMTALVAIVLAQTHPDVASRTTALFDSPLPTPTPESPVPTPPPTPGPSQAAQAALTYIANQEDIPVDTLRVVDDHPTEYPNLGRQFQVVTVVDTRPQGQAYKLLVDLQSGRIEEDVSALLAAEARAHQTRYGKLQPALYERLQTMRDDEMVKVTIWVIVASRESLAEQQAAIFAELAARYPEAQTAIERGGKPMDVDDEALAERIYQEYVQMLNAETASRVQPLVEALEAQGFAVRTSPGLPAVTVTLPKGVVNTLAAQDNIGAIDLSEGGEFRHFLNSAVPTNLAPTVWARGYDGTGVDIAILEDDNVDFTSSSWSECPNGNNCFRHMGATRAGISGVGWHASLVASAAASDHSTYRGMASGVTVMSAGMQGYQRQDALEALNWAFDQGAEIVNFSGGWCTDTTQMDVVDRAFDHYGRSRFRMIVVAAGQRPPCINSNVASPAKGWNVLSVGAYDDGNDANWGNDTMTDWSAWMNPDSPNHDHEKPEVVAPGVSITGIEMNGNLRTEDGTSFAAPQVAGLTALLIHRNWSLNVWPEANPGYHNGLGHS